MPRRDLSYPRISLSARYEDTDTRALLAGRARTGLERAAGIMQQGILDIFIHQRSRLGTWRDLAQSTVDEREDLGLGGRRPIYIRDIGGRDDRVLLEALMSPQAIRWSSDRHLTLGYPDRTDARFRNLQRMRDMLTVMPEFRDRAIEAIRQATFGRASGTARSRRR